MKKNLAYFITFAVGAAIGGYASWQYAKKKYEALAQEEIDSVKEAFSHKETVANYVCNNNDTMVKDFADIVIKRVERVKAQQIVDTNSYRSSEVDDNEDEVIITSSADDYPSEDEEHYSDKPYVISPAEFGEKEEYETVSLIYFADGVLTNDDYDEVADIELTVGRESLNHFGEYEDDSVFVRNDNNKCDYEILKDLRTFSDVLATHPITYHRILGD